MSATPSWGNNSNQWTRSRRVCFNQGAHESFDSSRAHKLTYAGCITVIRLGCCLQIKWKLRWDNFLEEVASEVTFEVPGIGEWVALLCVLSTMAALQHMYTASYYVNNVEYMWSACFSMAYLMTRLLIVWKFNILGHLQTDLHTQVRISEFAVDALFTFKAQFRKKKVA